MRTKLYKLTDEHGQTYNNTQWGEGVTHTASDTGALCTTGWLHAYTDPYIAILLNPIHADFTSALLWTAEGEIEITEYDLKVECTTLTTLRTIPLPILTTEQRVHIAVLCALEVYHKPVFVTWANNWINGTDRSRETVQAATRTVQATLWAEEAALAAVQALWAADAVAEWATCAAAQAEEWAEEWAEEAAYAAAYAVADAAQKNIVLRNIIYSVVHPGA